MKKMYGLLAVVAMSLLMSACYNDDDLWNKVDELETKVEANAADIATLSALVDALNQGKIIVKSEQTENGYVLTFNDGSKVEVFNGQDGANGKDGASGENGDSFFKSVEETDELVIITLADGRVIKLPKAYELRILTFEDKDAKFTPYTLNYCSTEINTWSDLIAEDQYGDYILGYGAWMGDCVPTDESHYSWYDENNTFLAHDFPKNYDAYTLAGGGHAISNYASSDYKKYGDYMSQLTVYDKDAIGLTTKGGGHNRSNNFAMHYGYFDGSSWNQTTEDDLPAIYFKDEKARIIDHLWVCLSTYEYNCLYEGNGLTAPLREGDYVIVEAIGHKEDGTTKKISIRVADLQSGVIDDWTKWDLSSLGKVKKVHFNIIGTNDNGYGFSQPAYFAYDDVAVRFAK